jgi:ribosome-associated toxin RatA of RatAB toxin-antitoxin module
MIAMTAVASETATSESDSQAPQVSVTERDGVYSVAAEFHVSQPPSTVLAVLTDYEQIPRFMPGVTTSIVRERSAERVVVEQEAVSRVMMFSKRVYLLLAVERDGYRLRFRDCAARSFALYEGTWTLSQRDGQTAIRYELRAKPTFDVPGFLLKRLLTRDAKTMIDRLRQEIAARPSDRARIE